MRCKRCKRARGLIDGLCDDCSLELHGCLFPWLEDHNHKVCEKVKSAMDDRKCTHSETRIELTKSGIKRVCKGCGKILKDLGDEVTIEKVILPMPDLEK